MHQFLKSILSFIFIFIFAFIIVLEITEIVIRKKANFKINSNSKYIVLGHSHPECAYNDSVIDNFINLSKFGDSYYYTYFKAQKVLEQNPNIEVVFIEYTNNQINETMNELIWGNNYLNYRYPIYSPFIGISDKKILAKNNIKSFIKSVTLSLKYNLTKIVKNNFNYAGSIGGYLYLVRDKTDSLSKIKSKTNIQNDNKNISEYNILYLSKIIDLCNKLNKTVFLIRSPLHEKYEGYSNELIYQEMRKNKFSTTQYLDFSKFPLKNSEFGDFSHLNYKGAKFFSIWFNQLLEKGLTEKLNNQRSIDEEIKKIFEQKNI